MGALNRNRVKLLALGLVLATAYLIAERTGFLSVMVDPESRERLRSNLQAGSATWWVGPLFSLGYAGAVALGLPASILTLLGGAAFGFVRGMLWVTLGANLGASAGFWLARMLGRAAIEEWLGSRLALLDKHWRTSGFRDILALRLIPVLPFGLLNFACGITAVRWGEYALATAIGMLPGTVIYVLFAEGLLAESGPAGREIRLQLLVSGALLVGLSLVSRWLLGRGQARHGS